MDRQWYRSCSRPRDVRAFHTVLGRARSERLKARDARFVRSQPIRMSERQAGERLCTTRRFDLSEGHGRPKPC